MKNKLFILLLAFVLLLSACSNNSPPDDNTKEVLPELESAGSIESRGEKFIENFPQDYPSFELLEYVFGSAENAPIQLVAIARNKETAEQRDNAAILLPPRTDTQLAEQRQDARHGARRAQQPAGIPQNARTATRAGTRQQTFGKEITGTPPNVPLPAPSARTPAQAEHRSPDRAQTAAGNENFCVKNKHPHRSK